MKDSSTVMLVYATPYCRIDDVSGLLKQCGWSGKVSSIYDDSLSVPCETKAEVAQVHLYLISPPDYAIVCGLNDGRKIADVVNEWKSVISVLLSRIDAGRGGDHVVIDFISGRKNHEEFSKALAGRFGEKVNAEALLNLSSCQEVGFQHVFAKAYVKSDSEILDLTCRLRKSLLLPSDGRFEIAPSEILFACERLIEADRRTLEVENKYTSLVSAYESSKQLSKSRERRLLAQLFSAQQKIEALSSQDLAGHGEGEPLNGIRRDLGGKDEEKIHLEDSQDRQSYADASIQRKLIHQLHIAQEKIECLHEVISSFEGAGSASADSINGLEDKNRPAASDRKGSRLKYRAMKALPLDKAKNVYRLLGKIPPKISLNEMRIRSDMKLVAESKLFDAAWYLKEYPDVRDSGINPLRHFVEFGAFENRNPSDKFSTEEYLSQNSELVNLNVNALVHYLKFGKFEGKKIPSVS